MRASEAERERVAWILQQAYVEGRLDLPLLHERLDSLWQAATCDDLAALAQDVAPPPAPEPAAMELRAGHNARVRKEGRWPVPQHIRAVAEKDGRIHLDFTQAHCPHRVVIIEAACVSNGPITLVVPRGWAVHTDAVVIRGNGKVVNDTTFPADPAAPTLRLSGIADRGRIKVSHPHQPRGRKG
ncbi:DUF1707 domain-containing protein [Streptomyces sp. Ac-502]|uniref:DUF1707 SHOCT-like domain-containing protein n=1 Tax=Streptomyces sp. Ac-502 TaxID=3342801 RepID=UPI003862BF09